MAYVLPAPGVAPRYTLSVPRLVSTTARSVCASAGISSARLPRFAVVQRKVQLQHVDVWLSEDPEDAALHVPLDQRAHLRRVETTGLSHAVRLQEGVGLGDVRVEAAEGGRDHVHRYPATGAAALAGGWA